MESLALTQFGGLYAGRRVLLTGHTGFKGSWLTLWLHSMGAEVAGMALDPDTNPSHWTLLQLERIADHRADIRNADTVRRILTDFQPEIVFHLAAQPLVRRSYRDPVDTFSTNVMGLVNVLEAVRETPSVRVLVNVTTDKVYADHAGSGAYREDDPLGGHDPYSSSKACAELVTDCYRKSFFAIDDSGVRIASARAGNVVGGGDWAEDRLVPDLIRAAALHQPLKVRNPQAIRPWQHVLEPISGYLRLAQALWDSAECAGAWNFGPGAGSEVTVESLVERLQAHWGELRIASDPAPHPHEAGILQLDAQKAQQVLGWQPVWDLATTLERTALWYRSHHSDGEVRSRDDLSTYVRDAARLGARWAA